ncbi:hypothetical protein [Paraburkholderia caffeinitolerans]|uniref:hypothetical protein n=1 Tax=Paraburkholderia caffeinitolerans TaxID=1723730 RepID=UPI00158242A0|nr:hypothetical protein [Paraburkholderia caffeinitolerans]
MIVLPLIKIGLKNGAFGRCRPRAEGLCPTPLARQDARRILERLVDHVVDVRRELASISW